MGSGISDYLIFSARFNKWGDGFGLFATEEWLKHFIIVVWITGRWCVCCGISLVRRVISLVESHLLGKLKVFSELKYNMTSSDTMHQSYSDLSSFAFTYLCVCVYLILCSFVSLCRFMHTPLQTRYSMVPSPQGSFMFLFYSYTHLSFTHQPTVPNPWQQLNYSPLLKFCH